MLRGDASRATAPFSGSARPCRGSRLATLVLSAVFTLLLAACVWVGLKIWDSSKRGDGDR